MESGSPSAELTPTGQGNALAPLIEQTRAYIAEAQAANTRKAYQSDWRHFETWCAGQGLPALPAAPATVALYLTAHAATHRPVTLTRRLTAINQVHRGAEYPVPGTFEHTAVAATLKGIRRTHGIAPKVKDPLLTPTLVQILKALPSGLIGLRDRALLLLGYAGGFRRSEIAALTLDDLKVSDAGLTVVLRRSKTDQEGEGREVGIPRGGRFCPVAAVEVWIGAVGLTEGPLFRAVDRHGRVSGAALHTDSIARLIQRAAEGAGLDPSRYAGHSLRAGLVTQAYLHGARESTIMRQTGHRSAATLRRYLRNADLYSDNAAAVLGL